MTGAGFPWFTQSQGNKIVLWQPTTLGMWHEYPVPTADSEPYGITIQGAEAVWFTERSGNRLGRFTGAFDEIALPTPGSLPTDIALDSAGCVWYTAPGVNRIGQLCPPFFRTYFPLIAKN
jgi:virginiamycin B lyase